MTDPLYDRLRAADPVPGTTAVEPADSPQTRALMEAAMSTQTPAPDRHDIDEPTAARRPARWAPAAIAAAAAGVLLAGAVQLPDLFGDDPVGPAASPTAMELTMPGGDPAMMSCIPLSPETMSGMPVAFSGTATAVSDDTVTLAVDKWFTGGDADTVELATPPDASVALLGYGIEFTEGGTYLITATEGTVNTCGFSGEATPELQQVFDAAFPG